MDISKLRGFDKINPATSDLATGVSKPNSKIENGPSFKETLDSKLNIKTSDPASATSLVDGVKFSNHALERMKNRGIFYSPADIGKLNEAVAKASAKGAKDSLILMNDSALIVSVKNNTVVTVMDKNALKENVFTNIDSTIVM